MKPDDRYEMYEEWEDDSERVERIRKSAKGKGSDGGVPRVMFGGRPRRLRRDRRSDKS